MAALPRWMVWMTVQAVSVVYVFSAPFPETNYGQNAREVLRDLYEKDFGNSYEPVGLTQRDQERLGYEDWQQKGELLSRHKYKFDNQDMFPANEYELWHDPEFLQGVYKRLFKMIYPALYKEYLNKFLSDLSNIEEETTDEQNLQPLKRATQTDHFWRYYVTDESNLPGLRRRSSFNKDDQYILDEGLPIGFSGLKRKHGDSWGDFKYSRTNRAFAKSSGVSDEDVVNKKGFADKEFQNFNWDNLQSILKRRSDADEQEESDDVYLPEEQEARVADDGGYRPPFLDTGRTWGDFLEGFDPSSDLRLGTYLDDTVNRRAEPIWGLVGPYAGYSMYGKLISEGKRKGYDAPFLNEVLEEEGALDLPNDNVLDYEGDQEEEDLTADDYSDEDDGHFWDNFLQEIKELPDSPKEPESDFDESTGENDVDEDSGSISEVNDDISDEEEDEEEEEIDALEEEMSEEEMPENDDVIEDEVNEEVLETVDPEEIKSKLRLDLIQLIRKILDLKRQ
ncbi:uncharacterized protein PF3D7_1120000-like [Ptychodera flava]|uniref:uncharacterized protein PF3D7_1120000-like n=1 Tax=Ptychodera flava TaxID=63121 RepID=UPI003969CDC9